MKNIIIAVIVFGVIIAIHEMGHFFVAKFCGIRVNKFAIGMGPAIFKIKKGETEYSLRCLPFGGYCAMEGEDEESDDDRAFNKKPVSRRMAVVAAGAVMNIILGFVLIIIHASMSLDAVPTTTVDIFADNSMSRDAGLQAGDEIKKINGMPVFTDEDIYYKIMTNQGDKFTVVVERAGEKVTLYDVDFYGYYYFRNIKENNVSSYAPYYYRDAETREFVKQDTLDNGKRAYYYDSDLKQYILVNFIGNDSTESLDLQKQEFSVDFAPMEVDKTVGNILGYSAKRTVTIGQVVWTSLYDLIRGKYKLADMSGPVGVVDVIGDSIDSGVNFRENLIKILNISILITINLGIMNLLPFPALDGGRLVFLIVEAIRRKPVPPEKEGMVHFVGLSLLMLLMIVITFNDIKKFFV